MTPRERGEKILEAVKHENSRASFGEYSRYFQGVWMVTPDGINHLVRYAVRLRGVGTPPYTVLTSSQAYDPERKCMVVTLKPWDGSTSIQVPVKEVSIAALAETENYL